jgi:hypothetical protein
LECENEGFGLFIDQFVMHAQLLNSKIGAEHERRRLAVQVRKLALELAHRGTGAPILRVPPAPVPTRVAVSTIAPTTFGCWPIPK